MTTNGLASIIAAHFPVETPSGGYHCPSFASTLGADGPTCPWASSNVGADAEDEWAGHLADVLARVADVLLA